jgi:hypothetical protein
LPKAGLSWRVVLREGKDPLHSEFKYIGPSLRSDVMKTRKGVPPRVEYVLEAQALKEARR